MSKGHPTRPDIYLFTFLDRCELPIDSTVSTQCLPAFQRSIVHPIVCPKLPRHPVQLFLSVIALPPLKVQVLQIVQQMNYFGLFLHIRSHRETVPKAFSPRLLILPTFGPSFPVPSPCQSLEFFVNTRPISDYKIIYFKEQQSTRGRCHMRLMTSSPPVWLSSG